MGSPHVNDQWLWGVYTGSVGAEVYGPMVITTAAGKRLNFPGLYEEAMFLIVISLGINVFCFYLIEADFNGACG